MAFWQGAMLGSGRVFAVYVYDGSPFLVFIIQIILPSYTYMGI